MQSVGPNHVLQYNDSNFAVRLESRVLGNSKSKNSVAVLDLRYFVVTKLPVRLKTADYPFIILCLCFISPGGLKLEIDIMCIKFESSVTFRC